MATNKDTAQIIYTKHIGLASTDGRNFRKTVMDEIMATCGCTLAASATFYNNCKKAGAPIEGLGRAPVAPGTRKPNATKSTNDELQADNDCFTVVEMLKHNDGYTAGRCRSYLMQGDASEAFDDRIKYKPPTIWVMISGLGPNHGDAFKLWGAEKVIKQYIPEVEVIVEKDPVLEY